MSSSYFTTKPTLKPIIFEVNGPQLGTSGYVPAQPKFPNNLGEGLVVEATSERFVEPNDQHRWVTHHVVTSTKLPYQGESLVDSAEKFTEPTDQQKFGEQLANENILFTEVNNQGSTSLQEAQLNKDDRLKRNPDPYTFLPQEPDKTSWTINIGIIEDKEAGVKSNSWMSGTNTNIKEAVYKPYGIDQGRTVLPQALFKLAYT